MLVSLYEIAYNKIMETLTTARLILRELKETDAKAIYTYINHDPRVLTCFLTRYAENFNDFSMRSLLDYFESRQANAWAIVLKENNECIGLIFENERYDETCEVEIGYAIGYDYWNHGYVSEAFKQIIHYYFSHRFCRIISASAFVENIASIKVMMKCGLVYSHTIKNELKWQNGWHDVAYYQIRNDR